MDIAFLAKDSIKMDRFGAFSDFFFFFLLHLAVLLSLAKIPTNESIQLVLAKCISPC